MPSKAPRYDLTPRLHACAYCGITPSYINYAKGNPNTLVPPHTLCDGCLAKINSHTLDPVSWWNPVSAPSPRVSFTSPNPLPSSSQSANQYINPALLKPLPPPSPYRSGPPSRRPLEVVQLEGPVIAYRGWDLAPDGGVHGAVIVEPWLKGVTLATCQSGHYEHPPVADCHCGLYGWKGLSHITEYGRIIGAVQLWGKLIEHGNDGWRAEKGRILAFVGKDDRAKQAAGYYGVPLLERQDRLELLAKELAI